MSGVLRCGNVLSRTLAAGIVAGLLVHPLFSAGAPVYPLKKSANGRYLVDQNNAPYLMLGDSPQALIVNLTTNEAATFFTNRSAYGFNTVRINLLCGTYTGGRANASTIDGIVPFTDTIPFTSSYDLTKTNEAYFARVDQMIQLAAAQGIQALLVPCETGSFLSVMLDNDTNKCAAYGQFLGNRYKNFPNIIWMSGNDFQDWQNSNKDRVVRSVALGIRDTDTNHIHTLELDSPLSSSLNNTNWAAIVDLNATYTFFPTYVQLLADYNRTSFLPNFMVEANYEFEDNYNNLGTLTPQILRRQEYWTMLSGAAGQFYGNKYTWPFITNWQNNLDTPGSIQLGYVKTLFEPRAWYDLIPDQNHVVVTAGYGTFSTGGSVITSDYATAARTADGTLVMAYMPTLRTLTVDMSKLDAPATARWYDPANGAFSTIGGSPFSNTGTRDFTPTGTNADGAGDWVLVLETYPPVLRISLTASNAVVVAWHAPSAGFTLQQNSDLGTTNWTGVTNTVNPLGNENQVTITLPATGQYYRLKHP